MTDRSLLASRPTDGARFRRRGALALAVAVAAGVGALAGAAPAQAHNYVVSTGPVADSVVTQQPGSVAITTNDNLLDTGSAGTANAIQVTGPSGTYFGDGCTTVAGATISMPAVLGEAGAYTVVWQTVSTDGHPINGQFAFTWQPDAGQTSAVGATAVPVCGQPIQTPEPTASATPVPDASDEPRMTTQASETPAASAGDSTSSPVGIIVGIGIALVILIIAAIVFFVVQAKRSRAAGATGGEKTEPPTPAGPADPGAGQS